MTKKKPLAPSSQDSVDGSENRQRFNQAWEQINQALTGLKYGQVTIIVQDGVVVQIDRIERKRLT